MAPISQSKRRAVSVADAKREFSDLLGRVAYGGETVLITRHGKPMAKLVPVGPQEKETPFAGVGWLDEDDPFFEIVEEIVTARTRHKPRILRRGPSRRSSARG